MRGEVSGSRLKVRGLGLGLNSRLKIARFCTFHYKIKVSLSIFTVFSPPFPDKMALALLLVIGKCLR